jgi:hypothetical protein
MQPKGREKNQQRGTKLPACDAIHQSFSKSKTTSLIGTNHAASSQPNEMNTTKNQQKIN